MESLIREPPPAAGAVPRTLPPGLLALGLVLAGLLAFANTLSVPFLLDDAISIVENGSIRRLWPITGPLNPPATTGVGGRPIANLSFALNYAAGGLNVQGYHVFNLLIHLAAGLTLFGVVRRTLRRPNLPDRFSANPGALAAFTVALLWLVHPLHTESVTYISQRTESLMGLLYLLTVYCFVRGAETDSTPWFLLAVVTCLCGVATKEIMVTAPLMLLLYDRTFLAGTLAAAWAKRRGIYVALGATWIVLLFLLVDVHERGVGYAVVAWWQYALTEAGALLHYLRLALWPAPLVFDYGTDVARSVREAWPQALAVLALLAGTVWALRRAPRVGFFAAGFFLLLAPTSSFVPVAGQPVAEHRMYLPLIFVLSPIVLGIAGWGGPRALLGCALPAVVLGWASFQRNRDYRDSVTLWTDTVAQRPTNARAHAALGAAYLEKGDASAAVGALERALQLDPRSAEAHNNLAMALIDVQRAAEAVAHFETSLRLRPGVASTHYNFGNALLSLGRPSEALAQQRQALILQRDFPEARCALADALRASGRSAEAIAHYREALRLQPALVPAVYGLGNALAQSGQAAEAVPYFEATLRAVPNSAEAHHDLANAYAATGRRPEAIQHYETALKLRPDFAQARAGLDSLRNAK